MGLKPGSIAAHRTVRGRPQTEGLPGLPDALPDVPPKAREYAGLSLDEAIARAHTALDGALTGATVRVKSVSPKLPTMLTLLQGSSRRGPVWAELTDQSGVTTRLPLGVTAIAGTRLIFTGRKVVLDPARGSRVLLDGEPVTEPVVVPPDQPIVIADSLYAVTYWRRLPPPDPNHVYTLFSGGGDSSILAHLMRSRTTGYVHIDTGTGIPATGQYVRAVCAAWNTFLHIVEPDDSYRDLVLGRVKAKTKDRAVWKGFPGPAGHHVMYVRLKERALDKFRRAIVGRRGRSGQIVFLAGMRWGESDRRFRNAEEFDHWGSVAWCSPIVYWTDGHVAEYRARYMCHENHEHAPHRLCRPGALPRSEVTDHLHMSGDCLCGAFAKPGELDQIRFFYPDVAARLDGLQEEAKACGLKRWLWGAGKLPGEPEPKAPGLLCRNCVPEIPGQTDLLSKWLADNLISGEQYARLSAVAS